MNAYARTRGLSGRFRAVRLDDRPRRRGKGYGLAAVEPGSAAEPGGDRLGFLEIAIQHRQRVAGVFPQPRILAGLRLGLKQLDRFLMVFDLILHEGAVELRAG